MDVDPDAGVAQPGDLGVGVALGRPPVGHHDDAPAGVGGQHGGAQAQGAGQVGAVGVDLHRRGEQRGPLLDGQLQAGVAAEESHAGHGAGRLGGQRLSHPRHRLGPPGRAQRVGGVDQEHRRHPVTGAGQLHAHEGADHQHGHGRPCSEGEAGLAPAHAHPPADGEDLGRQHGEEHGRHPREQRLLAPRRLLTRRRRPGLDRQCVGRRQLRLPRAGVHRQGPRRASVLGDHPEAGPVGRGRRVAGGHLGPGAARALHRGAAAPGQRQGVSHLEVVGGQGGAGQLGHQPVPEDGERHLDRQVALGQGEPEVGEGPPLAPAPDQQRRLLRAHQHDVAGRGVESLGPAHRHLGQVDARQQGIVAPHQGHRRPLGLARDLDPRRSARRGDGQERGPGIVRYGHPVVDGQVEALGSAGLGGALDGEVGDGVEEPVEEHVLGAGDEDPQRPAAGGHRPQVVVGDQEVLAFEEGFDAVAGGELDGLLDRLSRRQVELDALHRAPVDVEAKGLSGVTAAGVAHRDPGHQPTAPGLHAEAGERPVGGALARPLVAGAGWELAALSVGEAPVGQEYETDVDPGGLQALGQGEGGGEVGAGGGGRQPAEGVGEGAGVGAGRQHHPWPRPGLHQAGHPAGGQPGAQLAGPLLRRGQAVGVAVERSHRARRVDHEHGVSGQGGLGGPGRAGGGHGQQRHRQ